MTLKVFFSLISTTWYYNQRFILSIILSPVTFFYSGDAAGNLSMVCCFFTTTHLFTSTISHRLLFSTQISPNWIILHILYILHTAIILFSNMKNFFRGRNFESDDEAIIILNHHLERLDCDLFLDA